MDTPEFQLDAMLRAHLIDTALQKLNDCYIFPEVAQAMEDAIRRRMSNGEYDTITTGPTFADTLTTHLRAVSHDKHLRVVFSPAPLPLRTTFEPTPEERQDFHAWGVLHNFGFASVQRLPGNIGYLDLHAFFAADAPGAAETAVAAMNFLAHLRPLIIDLRHNGGGDPRMVALITSYLVPGSVHLNSFYWREGDRLEQFWTLPYVPGPRDGEKPVYVLTSGETFSGAEEFTYNLQHMQRATIVGEPTGGGAHPGGSFPLHPHFGLWIPSGRPINPITGTNWEGTGVVPDIAVPADTALKTAQMLALKQVLDTLGDDPRRPQRDLADEVRGALKDLEGGTGSDAQAPAA